LLLREQDGDRRNGEIDRQAFVAREEWEQWKLPSDAPLTEASLNNNQAANVGAIAINLRGRVRARLHERLATRRRRGRLGRGERNHCDESDGGDGAEHGNDCRGRVEGKGRQLLSEKVRAGFFEFLALVTR
jgi:hypothetical protein